MKSTVQRTDRVADALRREISGILAREVKDPCVRFVTVTAVRVTKDLRNATVYFTTMQDESEFATTAAALKRSAGFVQRKLGERMRLRYMPHLRFVQDTSLRDAAHMDELLRQIERQEGGDENS